MLYTGKINGENIELDIKEVQKISGGNRGCFLKPDHEANINRPTILILSFLDKELKCKTLLHELTHYAQYMYEKTTQQVIEYSDYEKIATYIEKYLPYRLFIELAQNITATGHIPE